MGLYLGQMPPAEMARLKAEIAETLIAYFSYPRFYDYRTNSLRMRPVDRAKRQEVWTFLSTYDFNTFSRIDVASPDFQRQVERLFIQFVQRNRTFFGQQGRKRMPDVRELITSSSASVTGGLRGHLSGRSTTPFGNARPVVSWSKSSGSGRLELAWEQVAGPTMLLQQQLQEVRGETGPGAGSDDRPTTPPATNGAVSNGAAATLARRSPRLRATSQSISNGNEAATPAAEPAGALPSTSPLSPDAMRTPAPTPGSPARKSSGPLAPPASPAPAAVSKPPVPPATPATEATRSPVPSDQPVLRAGIAADVPASPSMPSEKTIPFQERSFPTPPAASPVPPAPAVPVNQQAVAQPQAPRQRELTRTEPLAPSVAEKVDSATLMVSDEDVVIFEEMRHQLLVWLRVEVVRTGIDLTGQTPAQLLEILGQKDGVDETRLHIVSTLLGLVNQVIANGYATLVDYKQAMMFHLIHTRRSR